MGEYLVLNEQVENRHLSRAESEAACQEFASAIAGAYRVRGSVWLAVRELYALQISAVLRFSEWGKQSANRDAWTLILRSATAAPEDFAGLQDAYRVFDNDYKLASGEFADVEALALAHSMRRPVASIPTGDQQRRMSWNLLVESISDADELVVDNEVVPNVFNLNSFNSHRSAFVGMGELPNTGADVWARRVDLYPLLTFLPRVEGDLSALDRSWVAPVARRLEELQRAAEDWDTSNQPMPTWRSHVTGESATRRLNCVFEESGTPHSFEMHARFTPGAGRLHFRVARDTGRIHIAYIGDKLAKD